MSYAGDSVMARTVHLGPGTHYGQLAFRYQKTSRSKLAIRWLIPAATKLGAFIGEMPHRYPGRYHAGVRIGIMRLFTRHVNLDDDVVWIQ